MKDMETRSDTDSRMEVHSEKVRRLLGDMPRSLTVWGSAVIAAVFIGLLAAVCLLPYPYADGETILEHLVGLL